MESMQRKLTITLSDLACSVLENWVGDTHEYYKMRVSRLPTKFICEEEIKKYTMSKEDMGPWKYSTPYIWFDITCSLIKFRRYRLHAFIDFEKRIDLHKLYCCFFFLHKNLTNIAPVRDSEEVSRRKTTFFIYIKIIHGNK